jgi:soluble lytic murein transglycosylase
MLWDGKGGAPLQRMLTRVDPGRKALAEARMRLRGGAGGVEAALKKVPPAYQNDPGLLYERTKWRRIRDMNDGAREALLKPPADLVRPDLWWREAEYQSRQALRDGDISLAYKIAAAHKPAPGKIQADAEFLAGFIALRFLEDPKTARGHFQKLFDGVNSPVSRSRGAYWAGRTAEAANDPAGAKAWYAKAAEHQTTFYGQLAAGKLNEAAPPVALDPTPTASDRQSFRLNEIARAAQILSETGNNELFVSFALALLDRAKTPGEKVLALAHIRDLGRMDTTVALARRVARDGTVLIEHAYPTLALPKGERPEAALVHAIIRQESNFDQNAVSRVKAQGLMQLMPATAKIVAKELGVRYDMSDLTQDPNYNIRLGSTYLGGLIDDFSGSYIAAIAGYNAGPGRIRRWLRDNGDIRRGEVDVIDWIEQIPITETRNYVQRVLEGLHIYRSRLPPEITIAKADAVNKWCLHGCGGVIESNLKARIGKAGAEGDCDAKAEEACPGETLMVRDEEPAGGMVNASPVVPAAAAAAAESQRSSRSSMAGKD